MKKTLFVLFFGVGFILNAQTIDYNTKKGFVAKGYDVVAYFDNTAKKGNSKYIVTNDGVKYKFTSQENLEKFIANPSKYIPQYGGYCAYAIAVKAKKVSINPETFEVRDGKLYLFYNSWGTNTLESWKKESPGKLQVKADKNWAKINNN
ncbi:hypothetical protein FBALC1_08733 [Flavobacteriales bacterium ALC-1]|nr:hypothetical protein FBALC1_08733 [Flavobacteriales bacterium ALC-1]